MWKWAYDAGSEGSMEETCMGLGSGHAGCEGDVAEGVSRAPFLFDMLKNTANVASSERPADPTTNTPEQFTKFVWGKPHDADDNKAAKPKPGKKKNRSFKK